MAAGIIGRRATQHRRSRRKNLPANQPQPVAPILITTVGVNLKVLTLTFDQVVQLTGTPGFTTDVAGPVPVSAVQTAPNIVAITFDLDISGADLVNVGFRDPAIRNTSGGYVTSNVVPT